MASALFVVADTLDMPKVAISKIKNFFIRTLFILPWEVFLYILENKLYYLYSYGKLIYKDKYAKFTRNNNIKNKKNKFFLNIACKCKIL
jgi:hypothetical protein